MPIKRPSYFDIFLLSRDLAEQCRGSLFLGPAAFSKRAFTQERSPSEQSSLPSRGSQEALAWPKTGQVYRTALKPGPGPDPPHPPATPFHPQQCRDAHRCCLDVATSTLLRPALTLSRSHLVQLLKRLQSKVFLLAWVLSGWYLLQGEQAGVQCWS